MPDRMPEDMPDRMPEDMSDRMPEDLPVTKCINVMVGITRSKVIDCIFFWTMKAWFAWSMCPNRVCIPFSGKELLRVWYLGCACGIHLICGAGQHLQPLCHHLMHYWQPPRDLPNVSNDEIPGWLSTVWRYIALLCWGLSQSTISHVQPKQHTEMTGWLNR